MQLNNAKYEKSALLKIPDSKVYQDIDMLHMHSGCAS